MLFATRFRRLLRSHPANRSAPRRSFVPRLEALEDRSLPSTFTVTNLADSGAGSLRAAVAAANASPGPDAIAFAPGLSGTIALGSTLEITDGLTVQGPGPDTLTLYGQQATRVLRVAAGVTAGVSGLTVAGGWDTQGGGIRNDGSLTLDRVTVWGNEAGTDQFLSGSGGGIYNSPGASLTITRSTISNNVAHTDGLQGGGGIYNGGALSIFASNFSGNEVRSPSIAGVLNGSAVYNCSNGGLTATATIDSCTFTANRNNSISSSGNLTLRRSTVSGDQEVGVECSGTATIDSCTVTGVYGRGIEARGSLTLVNSTVAGNQGAGLTVRRGSSTSPTSIAIANCTIAGNTYNSSSAVSGAGIDVTGNGTSPLITLHNTIVAGNVLVPSGGSPILKDLNTSTQTTILVQPPRYESLGYNLIQDPGGATIAGTTTGNLLGVDPLLGPLADNGGPTQTMALLLGSPAIDAGDNTGAPAYDQRGVGFARIVRGTIDMGAFEVQLPEVVVTDVSVMEGNSGFTAAIFTVTLSRASADPVTVNYATADGSATAGSDYQAASGTLTFAPGETSKTITVLVNGDRLGEPNETFAVNLSGAINATIADGQGLGTIVDDEPRISINDVSKLEGKKGQTTLLVFTVTLSTAYDQPVTMSFRTADGTAMGSDNDYVAQTGTLTFNPGETTKTITIEVQGDNRKEPDEIFYLDLFDNSGDSLFTRSRGVGTILNDD